MLRLASLREHYGLKRRCPPPTEVGTRRFKRIGISLESHPSVPEAFSDFSFQECAQTTSIERMARSFSDNLQPIARSTVRIRNLLAGDSDSVRVSFPEAWSTVKFFLSNVS